MSKRLLVIGSANYDIFIKVERPPQVGETISGKDIINATGGKGFNTAMALGKLGYNVEFLGQVGNDSAKNLIIDELNKNHIDISNLSILDNNVTGQAYIFSYPTGNNSIVIIGGANKDWEKDKENRLEKVKSSIEKAEFVLLQREVPEEVNIFISKYAKSLKIPVLVDVGGEDTDLSIDLLSNIDILSPNETELNRIINFQVDKNDDNSIIKACEYIRQRSNNKNLEFLIKLGHLGSKFINKSNDVISQPAFSIESMPIIDTTGAGDCFTGSFCGCYLNGNFQNISESLKFATACAYKSITRFGAGSSMPSKEEAEEVLSLVKN